MVGEYDEFKDVHYPRLFPYVILLAHENEDDGRESLGSGVKIALGSHHLIATAAHCIKRNPRVIRDENFYITTENKIATSPRVRLLQSWVHDTLDIGWLEIGEALGAEMTEESCIASPAQRGSSTS